MFSASAQEVYKTGYNFSDLDYIALWKGVFVTSLRKVLEQVHPSLTACEDALDCVEDLIIQLLGMLCSRPTPHTIYDIEDRVRTTFPTPIDKWALEESRDALEKYKKKMSILVLPVEKTHQILQKDVLQYRIDIQVAVYIVAVLEYISADLLKLTGNYIKNIHHMELTCQDIRVAMCADKVLFDMFSHITPNNSDIEALLEKSTHISVVKDFIHDEKQHLRNLNMISKVFLDEIANVIPIREIRELQNMFQNLNDITDLTFKIVSSVEDIVEMSDEKQPPLVGSYLEELAEDEEFEVYARYARDVIQTNCPDRLIDILSKRNVLNILPSAGQGFREAVKYYLPKLLRYPIWHCLAYFEYITILQELSPVQADKDNFEQLEGILKPLNLEMTKLIEFLPKNEKEFGMRLHGRTRHVAAVEKMKEIENTVDGFDPKCYNKYCTEFLQDDTLQMLSSNKRIIERRLILFDDMLVMCKRKYSHAASGPGCLNPVPIEYKLKDVFYIRKVEIKDRDDTDEVKNSFEIIPREQPAVTFIAKTYDEKCNWMSDLIMLNTRCMLDRSLNSVLEDEEKKNPIQLPPVQLYQFAEPDTPLNIMFEDRDSANGMEVKAATLTKLIERLTYHIYTDAFFVRTFLTTYHTFTTPQEFLLLLIDRFNVPDAFSALNIQNLDINSLTSKEREDVKRYKKQYYQPIQFRVLNVLKHWVDYYYDDFENNPQLLDDLYAFLNSIEERSMRKWANCILNILQRKQDQTDSSRDVIYTYDHPPPPIEWHIQCPESEWTILTLHPVELARQLTLIEYDMYRAIKTSELIGSVWTKDDKEITSPHIINIMKHTTNFTLWLERCVVETPNLEERIAVMSRMIEIMIVLIDLNNYNGALSVLSAMGSACVYRMNHTFQGCPSRLQKAVSEARELFEDHFKKYRERLRTLSPPCVPFFGIFLTKLLHIEEGNKDFLSPPLNDHKDIKLINFIKRRRITEIIVEIQQFQDIPYCLSVEPRIRRFIETLEPYGNMSEADAFSYLYQKSLEIEPRTAKQPLRCPRKWPDLNLKSPGIKVRSGSNRSQIPSHHNAKSSNTDPVYGSSHSLLPEASVLFPRRDRTFRDSSSCIPSVTAVNSVNQHFSSIFTPIFFGPDASSGMETSIHGQADIENQEQDIVPPLPPRVRRISRSQSPMSEAILVRQDSPPPLPPRRDSLHSHQNSSDMSHLLPSLDFYDSVSPASPVSPADISIAVPASAGCSKFNFNEHCTCDELESGLNSDHVCSDTTCIPCNKHSKSMTAVDNLCSNFVEDEVYKSSIAHTLPLSVFPKLGSQNAKNNNLFQFYLVAHLFVACISVFFIL